MERLPQMLQLRDLAPEIDKGHTVSSLASISPRARIARDIVHLVNFRPPLLAAASARLATKALPGPVDGRTARNHMRAIAGTLIAGVPTLQVQPFKREEGVQTHGFQAAS
jgi:hypothetical protein